MSGLFSNTFTTLESALSAREQLQSVHAANIANADTPHYKANESSFNDYFTAEQARHKKSALTVTSDKHISIKSSHTSYMRARTKENLQRVDGNTVDTQKEMAQMAENQLMHELTMRLMKGKVSGLANAIKEGR
ncbi:MAG: flagellar basal body rod protein FlgB [Mariprofundaceae bacterium]